MAYFRCGGGVIQTKILLPSNPTSINVSCTSETSASVSWSQPTSEKPIQKYRIYLYKSSTKPTLLNQMTYVSETNNLTYSVSNLTTDSTYYFAVTSVGSDGYENASIANTKSVTITEKLTIMLIKSSDGWYRSIDEGNTCEKISLGTDYKIVFHEDPPSTTNPNPYGGYFIAGSNNTSLNGFVSLDGLNWKNVNTIKDTITNTYPLSFMNVLPADHSRNRYSSYGKRVNDVINLWYQGYDSMMALIYDHSANAFETFGLDAYIAPGYIYAKTNGNNVSFGENDLLSQDVPGDTMIREVNDHVLAIATCGYGTYAFYHYDNSTSKTTSINDQGSTSLYDIACGLPTDKNDNTEIVLTSTSKGVNIYTDGGKTIYKEWMTNLSSIDPMWEFAPFPGLLSAKLTYCKSKDCFYAYETSTGNIMRANNNLSSICSPWELCYSLMNNASIDTPSSIVVN